MLAAIHLLRCPLRTSRAYSTIQQLQAAFRDPNSPFHIPPGSTGPATPHPEVNEGELSVEDEARQSLLKAGYDPRSFWEQPIVWGDHDAFQHVNNVRYVRFFESGRIKWMQSIGEELGGPQKAKDMITGKGVSLILKSISVNYRRPVTYPDTLLIGHKPHILITKSHDDAKPHAISASKTHFHVAAAAYSYSQRAIVAESDSVLVWYDYDKLRKCDPGQQARDVVMGRIRGGEY
ncbi:Thioesterase/thiol ester dehydrase-isomerase [Punctularia strigosozonata HHB-11173 SS5]|uniref:Thioesterase/thiol ester dehydrase-isomerase n=1 Tax=Punctularia strigosozonata (strain HHB-11173) TaxID=741275 RepID=UPI000441658F|nr:Thioesterase/thiol ester dehydrase-isomerase [Punctularia strigosozonata HHB-11173 SS5]EIN06231.1 Thioesterase/thiol ester dehydrase-isomerase [Punctularia strigosozonata HHB-11173 SS5]